MNVLPWSFLVLVYLSFCTNHASLEIVAGYYHNCVYEPGQTGMKCWGQNDAGQLGYEDANNRGDAAGEMSGNLPIVNLGPTFIVNTTSLDGYHSCAASQEHAVKCWGSGNYYQLGHATNNDLGNAAGEMGANLAFVEFRADFVAPKVAAGGWHSCVLSTDALLVCFGRNNYGQCGAGTSDTNIIGPPSNIADVDLGSNFTPIDIAAFYFHVCALSQQQTIKCFGHGQLGYGDKTYRGLTPQSMGDGLSVLSLGSNFTPKAVAVGGYHMCAVDAENCQVLRKLVITMANVDKRRLVARMTGLAMKRMKWTTTYRSSCFLMGLCPCKWHSVNIIRAFCLRVRKSCVLESTSMVNWVSDTRTRRLLRHLSIWEQISFLVNSQLEHIIRVPYPPSTPSNAGAETTTDNSGLDTGTTWAIKRMRWAMICRLLTVALCIASLCFCFAVAGVIKCSLAKRRQHAIDNHNQLQAAQIELPERPRLLPAAVVMPNAYGVHSESEAEEKKEDVHPDVNPVAGGEPDLELEQSVSNRDEGRRASVAAQTAAVTADMAADEFEVVDDHETDAGHSANFVRAEPTPAGMEDEFEVVDDDASNQVNTAGHTRSE